MRRQGLRGVVRGKTLPTTMPDTGAACPSDKVQRQFYAERPNQMLVSDFTNVSTWQGGKASYTWPSYSTCLSDASWATECRTRWARTLCWMGWSKRRTSAGPSTACTRPK